MSEYYYNKQVFFGSRAIGWCQYIEIETIPERARDVVIAKPVAGKDGNYLFDFDYYILDGDTLTFRRYE